MFNKIINFFSNHKDIVFVLLIVILGLPTSINLLHRGYFTMHDDIQVIRLYEMERCLLDGQIPCRWSPDMTAGYGQPLFNFYSVFPYYTGVFLRIFNLQFIDIAKILFLFTLIPSGIFMYLLVKEFFGRPAGIIGALFFLYAPYHAVDSYVRGALAEAFAITFFPLIFLSIYKLVKEEKVLWLVSLVFSLSAVFLSHNIMNMILSPFILLWVVFCLVSLKKFRMVPKVFLAFLWAFGISSFFLIPAFLEKKYVTIESLMLNYYDFHIHFVTKGQLLFLRYWDYGPSLGANSRMSFQIGWPHWWMVIIIIPFLFICLKKKIQSNKVFATLFFILVFLIASFFTHRRSLFLWERIPMLPFVQFPWRFLGVITFASSFVAGAALYFFGLVIKSKKLVAIFFLLLIGLVIGLNYSFFRPQYFYEWVTDQYKLSGKELDSQMKSAMLDYLPRTVKKVPEEIAPPTPWVIGGKANISEFSKRSDFWRFTIEVLENKPATIKVPVLDFPKWKVLDDGKEISFSNDNPEGVIQLDISPGKHTIVGWFEDTPVRKVANLISLFSFGSLVGLVIIKGKKMKTLFKKDIFWLLLVIVTSLISIYPLFHKGFYSFHDEAHIANLYEMIRGISIGQIPPRWAPDFSYGFGLPFFNFYYLFPFYFGAFFYFLFGASVFWSLKLVFLLSMPFSGIAFYFLMRKYFSKITSFSGSVIYMFTPYRAVDLYVRGAVGELWAFVAMPLVLLGYINLIGKRNLKNFLFCSSALAFLMITHNLTLVIFSPAVFIIGLFLIFTSRKKISSFVSVFLATIFGLLLSAYYWLPAISEKKFMQSGTPFDPFDHFPFIKQLIFPSWGYGVSIWGPLDGMSFQIGIINLLLITIVLFMLLFFWKKISNINKKMVVIFTLPFLLYLFLMNIRSGFIWKIIPLGEYLQFPWRALLMTTFLSSFFVGFIEYFPFKRLSKALPILLAVLSVILTFQYFKPQKYLEVTDDYYLKRFFADRVSLGKSEVISKEYANWTESYIPLTIWTEKRPESLPSKKIEIKDGTASYREISPINLEAEVQVEKKSEVIINNYYFPGWKALVDGKETEIKILKPFGNMSVPVVAGNHKLSVNFSETFIRSLSDKISLFSILIIFLLLFLQKFKKLKLP